MSISQDSEGVVSGDVVGPGLIVASSLVRSAEFRLHVNDDRGRIGSFRRGWFSRAGMICIRGSRGKRRCSSGVDFRQHSSAVSRGIWNDWNCVIV